MHACLRLVSSRIAWAASLALLLPVTMTATAPAQAVAPAAKAVETAAEREMGKGHPGIRGGGQGVAAAEGGDPFHRRIEHPALDDAGGGFPRVHGDQSRLRWLADR